MPKEGSEIRALRSLNPSVLIRATDEDEGDRKAILHRLVSEQVSELRCSYTELYEQVMVSVTDCIRSYRYVRRTCQRNSIGLFSK